MSLMAFIPARGGSKGIPGKNLVPLNGKPLIQYTIEAARASKYITDIFVSTDSPEISRFCESIGIAVPYLRPPEIATDFTSMLETVMGGLNWWRERHKSLPENFALLQPTSPLRTHEDIDKAYEIFLRERFDTLISVHELIEHPYECIKIKNDGWQFLAKPPFEVSRRQDYQEEFAYINGAIYLLKTAFFLEEKKFYAEGKSGLYFMEALNGIDIDDLFDLKRAEFYLQYKR